MFKASDSVRIINDPARIGTLTGKQRQQNGRTYWQIRFSDGPAWKAEKLFELVTDEFDPFELFEQGKLGRARDLRKSITHAQLSGKLADIVYSMNTTGTDFYAYQFKPVLKLLEGTSQGLLIADEVGLGKTIEAGLIWTELRSRLDASRLLVICPAMLREKWKRELRKRFGVDAKICNAKELVTDLKELSESQSGRNYAAICSYQGIRPSKNWQDNLNSNKQPPTTELAQLLAEHSQENPLVDLVIIDEAHYFRNPSTATHELGKLIRGVSDFMVLLSATPIQLKSEDLFRLLQLIDSATFQHLGDFEYVLDANRSILSARDEVIKTNTSKEAYLTELKQAQNHPLLARNSQLEQLIQTVPDSDKLKKATLKVGLASKLERLNLLSHIVTRTRKREVTEWRVIREPHTYKASMTHQEAQFYQNVTQVVRRYCEQSSVSSELLQVTPQRQISSSMPAALRYWRSLEPSKEEEEALVQYEDLGIQEKGKKPKLGPLLQTLVHESNQLGSLEDLIENDSKYKELVKQIKYRLEKQPDDKLIIFSYFRATLEYLAERLNKDGIGNILLHGQQQATGHRNPKDIILEEFRDNPKISILISSEVGSEGIDLQFSNTVINYDLPWNPMRIEQRIGRVDRLGQLSKKIHILNFLYDETIDARIHDRLFERLDIFRSALGGLEAILGEEIQKLARDLLITSLTPEEEEKQIQQTAHALENKRQEESKLEKEAAHLIAHGDYILKQVNAARDLQRFVSDAALEDYVIDFFDEHYPGTRFLGPAKDHTYKISISDKAKVDFQHFVTNRRLNRETGLLRNDVGGTKAIFKNTAFQTSSKAGEHISQFHPIVRFISSTLENQETGDYGVVGVELTKPQALKIPDGEYVFMVRRWNFKAIREHEKLMYWALPLFQKNPKLLSAEDAERLIVNAARLGIDWINTSSQIDTEYASNQLWSYIIPQADTDFEACFEEHKAKNTDRADILLSTLKKRDKEEKSKLEQLVDLHKTRGNKKAIRLTEAKLTKQHRLIDQRRIEIEQQQKVVPSSSEVSIGVIRLYSR
jgi:SNF2 family DNA or RNA helicase